MPKCLGELHPVTQAAFSAQHDNPSLTPTGLDSLLLLPGQAQTAGFGTWYVTAGAHAFIWAESLPSGAVGKERRSLPSL